MDSAKDPNKLDAFEKYKSSNSELDYLKLKEVKFYKSFRENGITDEAVKTHSIIFVNVMINTNLY